jgi:anti-sigma regulatory factor (Ser/Thr protein kinase)
MDIAFDGDLNLLRLEIADHAYSLDMSVEQIELLVLVVNELATNILEHGPGYGQFSLWADQTGVMCDIADDGLIGTPLPGPLPPRPEALSGHGLWVVRQLCDIFQVCTDRTGSHIRFHLNRN